MEILGRATRASKTSMVKVVTTEPIGAVHVPGFAHFRTNQGIHFLQAEPPCYVKADYVDEIDRSNRPHRQKGVTVVTRNKTLPRR